MKILVVSRKHGLAPFAWRLKRETDEAGTPSHDVEMMVAKDRFERAWDGRLGKVVRANDKKLRNLSPTLTAAKEGEVVVLTDDDKWTSIFQREEARYLFGIHRRASEPLPPVRLGSWFNGEAHEARHILFADLGLWSGGLGARIEGAMTLVTPLRPWPDSVEAILQSTTDELKAAGFRGLVQVGVKATGGLESLETTDWEAGWPWLQTHAFVEQVGDLGPVLSGSPVSLPQRFTVVAAISTPPWPLPGAKPPEPTTIHLPGENEAKAEATRSIFFHDVVIGKDEVRTAGLDGLVGVARGSGWHLGTARARLGAALSRIAVDEIQVRADAGAAAESGLTVLETLGVTV